MTPQQLYGLSLQVGVDAFQNFLKDESTPLNEVAQLAIMASLEVYSRLILREIRRQHG